LINENENLQGKLSNISRQVWNCENSFTVFQNGHKFSIEELSKMDSDHKSVIDQYKSKLSVVEEGLNKRNEK